MIIKDNRIQKLVTFGDLKIGDAFIYNNDLFLKTNEKLHPNAVLLKENAEEGLNQDLSSIDYVVKVELEIIIHNIER